MHVFFGQSVRIVYMCWMSTLLAGLLLAFATRVQTGKTCCLLWNHHIFPELSSKISLRGKKYTMENCSNYTAYLQHVVYRAALEVQEFRKVVIYVII